jgi:exopolysaccharide production protein ExoZ
MYWRSEMADEPRTVTSLQALRGIAALGVVLFHLLPFESKYLTGTPIVPAGFEAGRAGVDLFFVLSGFFFTWTTMQSPGGRAEAARFLLRRLTRIYPTYWFFCSLLLVMYLAGPSRFAPDVDVVASFLLLPTGRPTLLLVSWTLVFEVYFYLVFALILYLGRQIRCRFGLLSLWVASVVAARLLLSPRRADVTLDLVTSPLVIEFFAGCLAAFLGYAAIHSRLQSLPWTWLAALSGGLLATMLAFVWAETLFAHPWWRVFAFGIGAAVLLVGCIGTESLARRFLPRGMILLGDASYSLYLSHLFTIGVVGKLWERLGTDPSPANHVAAMAFAIVASIGVSIAAHRLIEKPLLRGMRHLGGHARRISRLVAA